VDVAIRAAMLDSPGTVASGTTKVRSWMSTAVELRPVIDSAL